MRIIKGIEVASNAAETGFPIPVIIGFASKPSVRLPALSSRGETNHGVQVFAIWEGPHTALYTSTYKSFIGCLSHPGASVMLFSVNLYHETFGIFFTKYVIPASSINTR